MQLLEIIEQYEAGSLLRDLDEQREFVFHAEMWELMPILGDAQ